jgi:hypothetical protein
MIEILEELKVRAEDSTQYRLHDRSMDRAFI